MKSTEPDVPEEWYGEESKEEMREWIRLDKEMMRNE